jgi:hypothetical protein
MEKCECCGQLLHPEELEEIDWEYDTVTQALRKLEYNQLRKDISGDLWRLLNDLKYNGLL